jgi:hypothetical protein
MTDTLTFEKMQAAIKALATMPAMPEPHMHIVSPRRFYDKRVRWLRCVECLGVLDKRELG